MEINVKQARAKISLLLDRALQGEEIVILRRGKRIARLVPFAQAERRLPDLSEFRDSIAMQGEPLSRSVLQERSEERY